MKNDKTGFIKPNDHILFQGDSITDVGRLGSSDNLGSGYVAILAGTFQAQFPELNLRVSNYGVGGDRTAELLQRWKTDCIELRPDVLSISIGVNDVWRIRGQWNNQDYIDAKHYEANYRELLDQAKTAGVSRFVLMSPTTIAEEHDNLLSQLLDETTEIVKKLAADYGAIYVPTREAQKAALLANQAIRWTTDGCHPTTAGHALMASVWLRSTFAA